MGKDQQRHTQLPNTINRETNKEATHSIRTGVGAIRDATASKKHTNTKYKCL